MRLMRCLRGGLGGEGWEVRVGRVGLWRWRVRVICWMMGGDEQKRGSPLSPPSISLSIGHISNFLPKLSPSLRPLRPLFFPRP